MVWYSHLFQNFPQFIVIHRVKGFGIVNKAEIDIFKKIRDTKGTFHTKKGSIKDRNGMDLREAEDIKKRGQEYTELYKKDSNDPDKHNGVLT